MRNSAIVIVICASFLTACASTTTTRLAQNVVRIDASVAPACGRSGALKMVNQMAAVETLRLGYDKYLISGMDQADNVRIVGYNANTTGGFSGSSFGNSYSGSYYGNTSAVPVYGGTRDAAVAVVMFAAGDREGTQAIDARQALGTDWQEIVAKGAPNTCM